MNVPAQDSRQRRQAESEPVVRLLTWQVAVRDHPERPSTEQCRVLDCLALRMNWQKPKPGKPGWGKPGTGFASAEMLAADAGVHQSTVKRATAWARKHGLLGITKRGHRRGDGVAVATTWELRVPPEPVSTAQGRALEAAASTAQGGALEPVSTAQQGNLYSSERPSLQLTGEHPSVPIASRAKKDSLRARPRARAGARAREAVPLGVVLVEGGWLPPDDESWVRDEPEFEDAEPERDEPEVPWTVDDRDPTDPAEIGSSDEASDACPDWL